MYESKAVRGWVEVAYRSQPPRRVPHVYRPNPFAPNTPNPVLAYVPKLHWHLAQALTEDGLLDDGLDRLGSLLGLHTPHALDLIRHNDPGGLRALWWVYRRTHPGLT